MPTDNASVLEHVQAISNITLELTKKGASLSNTRRKELIRNAEGLAIAAREPEENLYFQATQTAQNSAIRVAIDLGVFEKIPSHGVCISAADLSATLQVDAHLLIRIMRACTSTHLFQETSPSHYTHNAFSAIFLLPANRDMFKQMYDFLGQGVAFQYGHHTSLGFWEYLKEDPERAKVFNSGMQSLASVGGVTASAGPYPFDEELGTDEVQDTDVVIVDIGGGRGQALESIKAAFPRLKGRMVLQDVPDVIEEAKAGGLPSFIEPMAVSFFERQPIEVLVGALVYHFRRVFHDWSDEISLAILRNTTQAMNSRSRILIADTVVPEMDVPRHVALQDINMMSLGGMERTQVQWEGLLGRAGLKIKTIWSGDVNVQSVIEATLQVQE